MSLSIEQRLDILESREQIKEARARYGWHAVRGEIHEVAWLYTEDGIFQVGSNRVQGRDAIVGFLAASGMKPVKVVPLIHNDIIVIEGDTAHGTCAMENPGTPDSPNGFTGYYLDKLRRVNGQWLFSKRKIYNEQVAELAAPPGNPSW